MRVPRFSLVLHGLVAGLCACASKPTDTASSCDDPYGMAAETDAFHILYPGEGWSRKDEPILPSDFYLVESDGELRIEIPEPVLDLVFDHVDGFPTVLPILMPLSAPADPATVTPDRFLLFDIDDPGLEPIPLSVRYRDADALIYLVPERVLPEGAVIAIAVLDGILSATGEPLSPSPAFECARGSAGGAAAWSDPERPLLAAGVRRAAEVLEAAGTGADRVVALNTFHTGSPHAALQRAMDTLTATATNPGIVGAFDRVLPATDESGRLAEDVLAVLPDDYRPGGAFPALGTFVHGHIELPDFRPSLYAEAPITPGPAESVNFTVLIPHVVGSDPMPVVFYLHGISWCREGALALSDTFNGENYIIVSVDASEHYQRYDPEETSCGSYTYSLAYVDFSDVKASVERFTMDALTSWALKSWLEGNLDPLLETLATEQGIAEAPSTGTWHWLGHSLGGIHASLLMSVLPDADLAAGADFVGCATGGALPLNLLAPLGDGLFSPEPFDAFNLNLYAQLQTTLWAGDPLVHAPWMRADTLLQIAENDGTIPNGATEMLALAGSLPLLEPVRWEVYGLEVQPTPARANLDGGRTAGLFEFSPANHEMLSSSEPGDPDLAWRVRAQALAFFEDDVILDAYALEP